MVKKGRTHREGTEIAYRMVAGLNTGGEGGKTQTHRKTAERQTNAGKTWEERVNGKKKTPHPQKTQKKKHCSGRGETRYKNQPALPQNKNDPHTYRKGMEGNQGARPIDQTKALHDAGRETKFALRSQWKRKDVAR